MTRKRRWKRRALILAAAVVGLELLYLAVANIAFAAGLPERLANQHPEVFQLRYRWALTPWPGRVYARDLSLRFQDPQVAFSLEMATSRLDVGLTELFSRRFCARHARATGVVYRMLLKVDSVDGIEERVRAFPPIDGVKLPPLRPPPRPEDQLSADEIDKLWSLEFHDVDSEIAEVWLFEYRFRGRGHSTGSFGIEPLKRVWIGPVSLTLENGTLSVGPETISERFSLRSTAKIDAFDISKPPGLEVFKGIRGTAQLELPISSLTFARVYLPGASVEGRGVARGEVQLEGGRLQAATALELELPDVRVAYRGFQFAGGVNADFSVAGLPLAHVLAGGSVVLPLPESSPLTLTAPRARGSLALASVDLSRGLGLGWLHADLENGEATDARPLVKLASSRVPFFAYEVLGNGPLRASVSVDADPEATALRASSVTLGTAELHGAIAHRARKWTGAFAGHFGVLDLGVRLEDGVPTVVFFPPPRWLDEQLARAGIDQPPRSVR